MIKPLTNFRLHRFAVIPPLLTGVMLFAAARPAVSQILVDFESAPAGPFASYSEQGVTFAAAGGGGAIITAISPNGTKALLDNNSPRKELTASLAALGGASSVSIDLGDFDADADTVFLEIFNAANASLGFTSQLLDASFSGMVTLTLSAPGIDHAQFGARAPSVNGSSVYADNFRATVVPEGNSIALLAGGLPMLALALRKTRKRSA